MGSAIDVLLLTVVMRDGSLSAIGTIFRVKTSSREPINFTGLNRCKSFYAT